LKARDGVTTKGKFNYVDHKFYARRFQICGLRLP
jgi:hypothetical protein